MSVFENDAVAQKGWRKKNETHPVMEETNCHKRAELPSVLLILCRETLFQ